MRQTYKTTKVEVDGLDNYTKATVYWELIIETRDWGVKSLTPIVTQIELEDGTLIKPDFDDIKIEVEYVVNGEAMLPVTVNTEDYKNILVFFQVSL